MGSELGLRHLILAQVSQYYDAVHADKPFVPGETRVNYAGRVYDAAEMVNMVDAVLDFWLTAGEWSQKFEKKLGQFWVYEICLLYTSPSPRDLSTSRMPSSA